MNDIQKAERQILNKFTNMYTYKYMGNNIQKHRFWHKESNHLESRPTTQVMKKNYMELFDNLWKAKTGAVKFHDKIKNLTLKG